MNTGTPASTPGARRHFQRPGPRAPGGRGYAKLITTGLLAAVMLAVIAGAFLQATPSALAQTNSNPTGTPGIVDQANPNETLTTVRTDMTLEAVTSEIMDADGLTTPNWMYQWAHSDGDNVTDITGATASTYLVEDKDISKALVVKVTFSDDLSNTATLQSSSTQFVGPAGLIVWNTPDPSTGPVVMSGTTTKLAQRFVAASSADSFTLDFIQLTFSSIANIATIGDAITVTLNSDSSRIPGTALCTLKNPTSFSRDTLNKACYGLNCVRQVGKWANGAVPDLPSGLQPLAICLLSRAIGGWAQP